MSEEEGRLMKRVKSQSLENFSGEGSPEPIRVSPDDLHLAAAIFCFVHRECDAAYAFRRGGSVEFRCGLCKVPRSYEVDEPNFVPPAEIRPLFRNTA
jgi:hypothetical protein